MMTTEEYNDKPTGSNDGHSADLVERWDALKDDLPDNHAEAATQLFDFGDKLADRIVELEAQLAATDRLADAWAVEALQAARATNEQLHRRVQYMEGPHRAYEYELQTARDYHLNSAVKFSRLVGQLRETLGRIEWQTKTSQDHPVCAVVHEIAAAAIRAQGGEP